MIRLLPVLLLLLALPGEVQAMSLFSKNVMFSAVKGQVVLNGQPVAGAEVERTWEWVWNHSKGQEVARTDGQGHFAFGPVLQSGGMSKVVPHEPVVYQKITIRHGGKSYVAWMYTKHNYDDNGEVRGRSLSLLCELSRAPTDNGQFIGLCELR